MKLRKYLPLFNTILLLLLLVLHFGKFGGTDRIVVVDLAKVLEEFEMRKELYAQVEKGLEHYKSSLDSLETIIQTTSGSAKKEGLIADYKRTQQQAQSTLAQAENSIREQVAKKLDPLFKKFGEENACQVVLGITGSGGVLYGSNQIDMTEELIAFINANYDKG